MRKYSKLNESLKSDMEYAFGILREMGYEVTCEQYSQKYFRITISIKKFDIPPLMSPLYINMGELNNHITHINECIDLIRGQFKNIYMYVDGGSETNKSCGFRLIIPIDNNTITK